ncbi:hypothetical protein PIB30_016648 [Stylosanthes scabra]|uniref:Uncharacterized protein n=1 Tax=Stylosanthes scabra TaxID=79078 RepID=A0ABU6W5J7_9FABA|nr:hypothetical protein [Stylosanthes scabra]
MEKQTELPLDTGETAEVETELPHRETNETVEVDPELPPKKTSETAGTRAQSHHKSLKQQNRSRIRIPHRNTSAAMSANTWLTRVSVREGGRHINIELVSTKLVLVNGTTNRFTEN